MAHATNTPFNNDVIVTNEIAQYGNQQQQSNKKTNNKYNDLIDLLSWSANENTTDVSITLATRTVNSNDLIRLKKLIRSTIWPVNDTLRQRIWMNTISFDPINLLKQHGVAQQPISTTVSTFIDNDLHSTVLSQNNQWPHFVDKSNLCFYHLNESNGRSELHRVLAIFAYNHPDITYCPPLEPFSALFLHYYKEYEVLHILNKLLTKNWLCGVTHLQWIAHGNAFKSLARTTYKSAATIVESRNKMADQFYQEWFWWIFRYLPFSYIVKIMDCFLLEGPKIIFRISLVLFRLYSTEIKNSSDENLKTIGEFCQKITIPIDSLLRFALDIRNFKRSIIIRLVGQEEKLLHENRNGNTIIQSSFKVNEFHLTQIPKNSILNQQQFLILWNWLPIRFSLSQPILVFTSDEHGFRLQTLLNKVNDLEYSILIVKTTNNEIFGGFCAGCWSDRHERNFFGSGETFLFTLLPKQIKYSSVKREQTEKTRDMFLYVNNERLVIGGGNGYGLSIDQSLFEGSTAHCNTFDNEPLCSQEHFSISHLEMITFDFSGM